MISLTVADRDITIYVEDATPLLRALLDTLGLTGPASRV